MFFLISFVVANNYCIGLNTYDECISTCKDFQEQFDGFFTYIPRNIELNPNNTTEHNFYIASNVSYQNTDHKLIFCDPSIHLIYQNPGTKIKIKDHIYLNSKNVINDVPIQFSYNGYINSLNIEVETTKDCNVKPFILDFKYSSVNLLLKFLTDDFPENLISVTSDSHNISINEITKDVSRVFSNTDKLIETTKKYYCISDKVNKCKDYQSSSYDLNYVDSMSDIKLNSNNYIIVDTSVPQKYNKRNDYYSHIIALAGSDITFYVSDQFSSFYVILHEDTIEMYNAYFEGEGNITYVPYTNFSLHAASATNKNHFSIQSKDLYSTYKSHISALRNDLSIQLDKKIYVPEYSLFYGPNCLSGLFEPGKFFGSDDGELLLYNVTSDNLIDYDYQSLTYYFGKGDHEIPKTWKHRCTFRSLFPNETSFTFNDVYSYDGIYIDNFININDNKKPKFKMITIKPAKYFYLSSFKSIEDDENVEKYNIHVDKDFVMDGKGPDWYYEDFEIHSDQCTITGNGTISFKSLSFMKTVKAYCKIDDGIQLEQISSIPNIYVCIGQSDIDTCKSKIKNVDSIQNADWVWLRNYDTIFKLSNRRSIYITDRYELFSNIIDYNNHIILTSGSHLTVLYNSAHSISLYYNKVEMYRTYTADDRSAKFTVLYTFSSVLGINYHQAVTDFNFRCYFFYDKTKLRMKYVEHFTKDSINLEGRCQILIREPLQAMIGIFKKSELILFMINRDKNYNQICINDVPVEMDALNDFILCKNPEEFKKASTSAKVYVFKNISLDFDNNKYASRYYHFNGNITVSFDLPANATLLFYSNFNNIDFTYGSYIYDFYFYGTEIKFIFGINESISLNYESISTGPLSYIDFRSSKDNIYVFPYPNARNLKSRFIINAPEDLTIFSPAPQYIEGLFGSHPIKYSPNWTYYHLSEESRSLYGSHQSIPFENIENDENIPDNIVLAVGKDDVLTVPTDWTKTHNVYIYQGSNDFNIYKPLNITYSIDGVTINHKMKIIAGYINANVPPLFTVNSYFPCCHQVKHYPYNVKLDLTENPHVDLYVGSMFISTLHNSTVIRIYNRHDTNTLTVNATDANHMNDFNRLKYFGDKMSNVKYHINYDYICYYPGSSPSTKCPGTNYYHIKDIATLYAIIVDYPDRIIYVTEDFDIPYTNGDHYKLNPKNENINIDLPNSPESIEINENNAITFTYSDGSIYDILNKSIIDVVLTDTFKLVVNSNTDSIIRFSLDTDVYISGEMNCDADFNIHVNKNRHHLYTDNLTQFGNLLNDSLEFYIRLCAYDSDSISYCSFPKTDIIENVFTQRFMYNEVEIALASTPKVIELPSIKVPVPVYVLPSSNASLTLSVIVDLQLSNDSFIVNDMWYFEGDLGILRFKLNKKAFLSIDNGITTPIILELSSNKTSIDLKKCELLNTTKITILKVGKEINEITVFGTKESYNNFINNLAEHDGINIILNGTQKYLCICENIATCNKCEDGVEGFIERTYLVRSDPGENTKIRVFSDFEMPSNIFDKEHQVFINSGCTLNLTDIDTVNQNIDNGLKVDNLHFVNGSNLLLKPNEMTLNIIMRKFEQGKNFTIELDRFLRLNVTNSEEKDIVSSLLHVNGTGELNCYDYPFERIRPQKTVRVIKGVYVICGANEENNICSYQSVERYKRLGHSISFRPGFDTHSKILVFLDSYTSSIDAHLGYLSNQKVQFIRKPSKKASFLGNGNNNESVKLRFLSTTELVNNEDSTTELLSAEGGALLDNSDSDLFIVGFDENLTIKQEGNTTANSKAITIQPMNDKGTIFIDDSVDIDNQKLKIETETDKKVSITIHTNKNISSDDLKKYISADDSKIEVTFGYSTTNKTKKGLPISAVIGIVVGAAAIVAVIVLIVIFAMKKRKQDNVILSDDNQDFSDSTF